MILIIHTVSKTRNGSSNKFLSCEQVMEAWLCPSKAPVKWTSRQRTWRTGRVESPTAPPNQGTTSCPSASPNNTSQVYCATIILQQRTGFRHSLALVLVWGWSGLGFVWSLLTEVSSCVFRESVHSEGEWRRQDQREHQPTTESSLSRSRRLRL